ncbi:MAG TPA: HEAT repeat domain-containing protein [Bdellovibrionota bacterium]|nr:HEAT repeat domain-containing protein [Bdellovibrionota bacterium]
MERRGEDPREESLGLAQLKQVIASLERMIRSQRLYASNNPILVKHQQDLFQRMSKYLSNYGETAFVIEPFQMRVGDEIVYTNDSREESFAFRLFNDGVRTLKFLPGLTLEELNEFVAALNAPQGEEASELDAVTIFWETEFEHIEYTVADAFTDEPTSDDKSAQEKAEEIVDPNMTMYRGAGGEADEDIYHDLKVTLNMTSVGQLFQERCVLTPDELEKVREEIIQCDRPERLVLDFVDMVLAVLQEERDVDEFEKTLAALGSILDNNLMHGRLHIARMAMEQVHQFPRRPIEMAKADPNILPRTLKLLWTTERTDLFFQALNQEPTGSAEDIEMLVAMMDPMALPYLLKAVVRVVDPNRRRIVCHGIARLHRGDLGIYLPMLSSKDPDIIRSAIYILSAIRHEKVTDLLGSLIQHPDLSIRKEAIAVLRNFQTPKAFRMLGNLLNDSNLEIRLLALRILAASKDRDVAMQLTSTINREDFREKSLQERKTYYYAAGKILGDEFVGFLEGILETKSWFRRPELEELYQCATFALSVIASPKAKAVLERFARSKNKSVRRFSEAALRALAGGAAAAAS